MTRLQNVAKAVTRLIRAVRRKSPESSAATPASPEGGQQREKGISTREAVVVFGGIAVGILVGMTAGIGAGFAAGITAAALLNGLLRP